MDGPVPRDPLLIVVGPTAVGKSDFALLACERFGGEVVSVDSMQDRKSTRLNSSH